MSPAGSASPNQKAAHRLGDIDPATCPQAVSINPGAALQPARGHIVLFWRAKRDHANETTAETDPPNEITSPGALQLTTQMNLRSRAADETMAKTDPPE